MDFTIPTGELQRAIERARGAVSRKAPTPILGNVLVRATKGEVSLTGFDLDIATTSTHPAEVTKVGSMTLNAGLLAQIASALPETTTRIRKASGTGHQAEVTSGSASYKVNGLPVEDFPALPKEENIPLEDVSGTELLRMLTATKHAISHDETRHMLNGLLFEGRKAGGSRTVATDGHRLAMVDGTVPGPAKGILIPHRAVEAIQRLLKEGPEAPCQLGFSFSMLCLRRPGVVILTRLLDATFPEYERVVPKAYPVVAVCSRDALLEGLKRMSVLSAESNQVRLELAAQSLRLSTKNHEVGEADDTLAASHAEGAKAKTGFNSRYLIDALTAMEAEKVEIGMGDEQSPAVLRPFGDTSYTAVVMPMRLDH